MNLIYVADPMCSWCYGFGKTLSALLADPRETAPLQLALIMGGLRPYTTEPMAPGRADEILGHWKHVHEATGLPFASETAMHQDGFVYDTEPASRATIAVRTHWPQHVWRYFKAVQQAFYAEGKDVTRPEVLADVAEAVGLPRSNFANAFAAEATREATRADFAQSQAWGIRGFPALIAEANGELHLVAHGYMPEDELRQRLLQLVPSA
ncbi:DsbA family protein [Piscinibacter terrae]|uniref:DsbA family protein n=1 Tax=Piscinibacter terrae TaxID=2496871 RepID=A0A3N7HSJ3_9BURK|nr:DsbA family protein [Albitalea terrae]RQP25174.1 DsbA family protein [Albitalea terrae]